MKKPSLIAPRDAAARAGVSTETIRRWMTEGLLTEHRTSGGHRRIEAAELAALIAASEPEDENAGKPLRVGYARVSSHEQKRAGDLDRQVEQLRAAGCDEVVSEVGSGLSDQRNQLRRVLNRAAAGEVVEVVVTTEDRLARFGVGFVEQMLNSHGAGLTVLDYETSTAVRTPEDELVADLLAIVASFSGRLYGLRSAKRRRVRRAVEDAIGA